MEKGKMDRKIAESKSGLLRRTAFSKDGTGVFPGRILFFLMLLCSFSALTMTTGCVTTQHSAEGGLYVETLPSSRVALSNILVTQTGNALSVSGEVRRRNTAFSGLGHVDVAVVSPDGSVVGQGSAPYSPKVLPKTPGARKHRPSRFELQITCDPPLGSTVRVAFHGSHAQDAPSMESENYAIPEHHDQAG